MFQRTCMFQRTAVFTVPLALVLLALIACSGHEKPGSGPTSVDPALFFGTCDGAEDAINANSAEYAWQLFLELNEPLAAAGAKVWETQFRQTSTIFLSDGATPPAWGDVPPVSYPPPAGCTASSDVWHNLDTAIQVDGLALLDDWNNDVRYQLLMNEPNFDFIFNQALYNVEGQEQFAAVGAPANFAPESFELKTSWIWIGDDPTTCAALQDKYYIVKAHYIPQDVNGQPLDEVFGYAAMTGFHITNKCLPNWVWITFENVHNAEYTRATLELPLTNEVTTANTKYQQQLQDAGSIFANYQLDGVQTEFTDPSDGSPTLLANSNIESAFQSQSSCITCHSLASVTPEGEYFNMVDSSGGNLGYYVGNPPAKPGFTSLDFVWSLKRAHRISTADQ